VARNEEKLKKIKQEIEEKTSKTLKFNPLEVSVHIAKCDVSKEEDCKNLKENLPKEFQTVDILVNNAGYSSGVNLSYEENLVILKTINFKRKMLKQLCLSIGWEPL
jgi:3-hydroxy acid dehydrogenase / malonic semialdehyde reductase